MVVHLTVGGTQDHGFGCPSRTDTQLMLVRYRKHTPIVLLFFVTHRLWWSLFCPLIRPICVVTDYWILNFMLVHGLPKKKETYTDTWCSSEGTVFFFNIKKSFGSYLQLDVDPMFLMLDVHGGPLKTTIFCFFFHFRPYVLSRLKINDAFPVPNFQYFFATCQWILFFIFFACLSQKVRNITVRWFCFY